MKQKGRGVVCITYTFVKISLPILQAAVAAPCQKAREFLCLAFACAKLFNFFCVSNEM